MIREDDPTRLLRALGESAPIFGLVDAEGTVVDVSRRTCELLGYDPTTFVGSSALLRVEDADVPGLERILAAVARTEGGRDHVRLRILDGWGRQRHIELSIVNKLDVPDVAALVITGIDVTETRHHLITARIEDRVLAHFPAALVAADDQGILTYWNDRAAELFGIAAEDAIGRHHGDVLPGPLDPEASELMARAVDADGRWEGEQEVRRADGSTFPAHLVVERFVEPDIDFAGTIATATDVSERRRLEDELVYQAHHDPLTALPNRRRFVEQMEQVLARPDGARAAIAFIDLDDFKELNDRASHDAGDRALRVVAERIAHVLRDDDLVARIGGDEFVIGFAGAHDADEVLAVVERVLDALRAPYRIDRHRVQLSASIGVAVNQGSVGAEQLLRNADAAMYQAKELGKNRIALFDDDLQERTRRRRASADDLRAAVDAGRIHAHFQPQFCLHTGELVGFEALARWEGADPERAGSASFLAVAQESGVVGAIDRLVLAETAAAIARFAEVRPGARCAVSVNLSAELLADADLPALVAGVVDGGGFPPELLCIEVVEAALADVEAVASNLAELDQLGVEVAIDDFGTGYSSLSRIQAFDVDYLKIDRSFVAGLGSGDGRDTVVAAIIGLGRALQVRTIAEGVETEAQEHRLRDLGVDIVQGFRWSRAVPADDAVALVGTVPVSERPCRAPADR